MFRRIVLVWSLMVFVWSLAVSAWGIGTVEKVQAGKPLVCGVNAEEGDYSRSDDHGTREAFDRDLCRAVAVAIAGPAAKVEVKVFPDDATSLDALKAGVVDLLPTLTADFTHATGNSVGLSGVVLWDGVGFMVPMASGITRPEELAGRKICLLDGTEVEETVRSWFHRKALAYNPFPYQEEGEMEAGFVTGGCAAVAGDLTRLASTRIGFGAIAGKFRVLPGAISKDPLAMAYRRDDARFGEVVDWVVQVLLAAEELGITQASVARVDGEWEMDVRRITGKTHEMGARLGLADGWAAQVIAAVGNYGELYARDLGPGTEMGIERGWNRLSGDGGWMVALPLK